MAGVIKKVAWYVSVLLLVSTGVFLSLSSRSLNLNPTTPNSTSTLLSVPEPEQPSSTPAKAAVDSVPLQSPLADPPIEVRGIYLTGWTAGSVSRLKGLINLAAANHLNGMVIDVKDYSGYVSYQMDAPEVRSSGAENQLRIGDINAVIKNLHDHNLYAIARVSVFQDPILSRARPELALKSSATGGIWEDRKGLSWLDPAAEEVWKYNLAVSQDALAHGFDEINFDYIRFPSDGDLESIQYPFWNKQEPRHLVIKRFFKYLRDNMPDAKLSVDLFGLSTYAQDDLGIGQKIDDAYPYFDYVSPMVYPSHYASGVLGYKNPADYPYEIISYSLSIAKARLDEMFRLAGEATSTVPAPEKPRAKLRPWLQVFDLGATYDPPMVDKEVKAVEDALRPATGSQDYAGWLLWDPKNVYAGYRYGNE